MKTSPAGEILPGFLRSQFFSMTQHDFYVHSYLFWCMIGTMIINTAEEVDAL